MTRPRVKICCISNQQEANRAIAAGASALGLVGNMPSGPGIIADDLIAHIARRTPPPIATFLLTSQTSVRSIIDHYKKVQTSTIQLVDELSEGCYSEIRAALPHVKIVQVIHVINEASIDEALRIAEQVDCLLLDSGNPTLAIKELGGTGRVHNWQLSRKIREQSPIPLFLAGGLSPENVQQAIDEVQPFGVDVCSGVRSGSKLDAHKLERFFDAIEK